MNRSQVLASILVILTPACGAELATSEVSQGMHTEVDNGLSDGQSGSLSEGLRLPIKLRSECDHLKDALEFPEDVTLAQVFGCLTPETQRALDAQFRRKFSSASEGGGLSEAITQMGTMPAGQALKSRVFSTKQSRMRITPQANVPADSQTLEGALATVPMGFDPLVQCGSGSCLSQSVRVAGGVSRNIGYRPAVKSAQTMQSHPEWRSERLVDDVVFGSEGRKTRPNHLQSEFTGRISGFDGNPVPYLCGPFAGINLLEWWNIPIYTSHGQIAVSVNERANRLSECMGTFDSALGVTDALGGYFTDDENMFECLASTGRYGIRDAGGRLRDYPGTVVSSGDGSAFKVMLGLVQRGFPVVALYSTSESSLHWALVVGIENGMVQIANDRERTIEDFFRQWHGWQDLSSVNELFADLYVERSTFFAYYRGSLEPVRYAERNAASNTLPAYGQARPNQVAARNGVRYCTAPGTPPAVPAFSYDVTQSEILHTEYFPHEPNPQHGTCIFNGVEPAFDLIKAGARGDSRVVLTDSFRAFVRDNPGVKGEFWGLSRHTWQWVRIGRPLALHDIVANPAGDLDKDGVANMDDRDIRLVWSEEDYMNVEFFVHSPDFARVSW